MATLFGIDVQRIIGDAFRGQTQTGTLVRPVVRAFNPANPEDPKRKEDRYPFEGFVDERTTHNRTTAKVVAIFGSSIAVEPKIDDRVEINGEVLTISKIESDFTRTLFDCYVG